MTQNIIVSKFGGSSMANFETMSRSANIAVRQKSNLVVVSAVFGVTNDLIALFEMTKVADINSLEKVLYSIKEKHLDIIYSLNDHIELVRRFNIEFEKLDQIARGLLLLKEFNQSVYDQLVSFGERFSSMIFTEVFKQISNNEVDHIDSRDFIITDDFHSQASPLPFVIQEKVQTLTFKNPKVAGGFIGSTIGGRTTTIGRGGSDYSAALYAEALGACALEIWTDVDGISTCDPRLIVNAKRIKEISYKEASELAFYGAKILHPITIQPVKRKSIPIFVGSSLIEKSVGTWIKEIPQASPPLRAIAIRSNQIALNIYNTKVLRRSKLLNQIAQTFETYKISLDTLQMNETTLTVVINKEYIQVIDQLSEFSTVSIIEDLSMISFVGNMKSNNIRMAILSSLADDDLISVNLGASENSFSILINSEKTQKTVEKIHSKYL